jgi:hypothetical protein
MELKIERLKRDDPISEKRMKKSIEDIRQAVARDKNIKVSRFKGERRAAIYRNSVKVATVRIVDASEELSDAQIREGIIGKILEGEFDHEIRDVYRRMYTERIARKKTKGKENYPLGSENSIQ